MPLHMPLRFREVLLRMFPRRIIIVRDVEEVCIVSDKLVNSDGDFRVSATRARRSRLAFRRARTEVQTRSMYGAVDALAEMVEASSFPVDDLVKPALLLEV